MQVLCPFCSQENPIAIACEPEDAFALCERCSKRFRLHTFWAQEIKSQRQGDRYIYTCISPGSLEKFASSKPLSLRSGQTLTTVRRGRDVLGIADQGRDRWYPVLPPRSSHPLLRALGLSLAWPVSLLALLYLFPFARETAEAALDNPLGFILGIILVTLFLLAPLGLWLLRALFPQGPGRERIRGYDPRL